LVFGFFCDFHSNQWIALLVCEFHYGCCANARMVLITCLLIFDDIDWRRSHSYLHLLAVVARAVAVRVTH